MRILLNILILISLPIIYSYTAADRSTEETDELDQEYCNERFDFCLEYPEDVFTQIFMPDNRDGILLQSVDGMYELRVAGSYNIMDWSLEDIYYFSFEDPTRENHSLVNLEMDFDDTSFRTLFRVGDNLKYVECYKTADSFITITLEIPEVDYEVLDRMKEQITIDFTV